MPTPRPSHMCTTRPPRRNWRARETNIIVGFLIGIVIVYAGVQILEAVFCEPNPARVLFRLDHVTQTTNQEARP